MGIDIGWSMEGFSEGGGFASIEVQIYVEKISGFDINLSGNF